MKNGAAIYLEAAWALNVIESKEASTTLCGTLGGAEIRHGMSYPKDELVFNRAKNGILMEEKISSMGAIDFFEGSGQSAEGIAECAHWLNAILNGMEPLVKPEEAFTVTQVLDSIYQAAKTGETIKF
jgi:predicted dehydrogenase